MLRNDDSESGGKDLKGIESKKEEISEEGEN